MFKEELTRVLHKLFPKIGTREDSQSHSMKPVLSWKLNKGKQQTISTPNDYKNPEQNINKPMLYLKIITHHDQLRYTPESKIVSFVIVCSLIRIKEKQQNK